jgi:hypothetical protein
MGVFFSGRFGARWITTGKDRCLPRGVALTLVALLAWAAIPLSAQEKTEKTEKAQKTAKAPRPDPAFLEQFETENTSFAVLFDPLPHLERVLLSAPVSRILKHEGLARLLKDKAEQLLTVQNPQAIWKALESKREFVPIEVAVGWGDAAVDDANRLLRSVFFLGHAACCSSVGTKSVAETLPQLHELLAAELSKLGLPRITLWARFRKVETARMLFQQAGLFALGLGQAEGMKVLSGKEAVSIQADVGKMLSDEMVLAFLGNLEGLSDTEGMTGIQKVAAAARNLRFEVCLELVNDGLRLTLGPKAPKGAPGLDKKQLGSLYQPESNAVAFARWEARKLKSAAQGWMTLLDAWRETPVGKKAAELDTEDLLGTLRDLSEDILRLSGRGSLRLWTQESSLRLLALAEENAPAVDLAGSPVLTLLPAGLKGFYVHGGESIADLLKATARHFEDRLATNTFMYDLQGKAEQAQLGEIISKAYYGELSAFRKLLLEKSSEIFEPPLALIAADEGRVEELKIRFFSGGKETRVDWKDVPILEIAYVGRVRKGRDVSKYLEETYATFVGGLLRATGATTEGLEAQLEERDLGLPQKAQLFRGNWIQRLSPRTRLSLEVQGDLAPHFFTMGDFVVVSTSPRLSRRITDVSGKHLVLPAGAGKQVSWGWLEGKLLANTVVHAGRWLEQWLASPALRGIDTPEEHEKLRTVLSLAADVARMLATLEGRVTERDGVRTFSYNVTFE